MSQEQDAVLVRQCLDGNQKAFETLVDRYQRPIYNLALRFAARQEDAEDIVQTVFVKVYEKLNTYDPKHKAQHLRPETQILQLALQDRGE